MANAGQRHMRKSEQYKELIRNATPSIPVDVNSRHAPNMADNDRFSILSESHVIMLDPNCTTCCTIITRANRQYHQPHATYIPRVFVHRSIPEKLYSFKALASIA